MGMKVKRFADACPYEAANHEGSISLRLQGFEEGGPSNQWLGLSHYLPGGRAGPDASSIEKVYFIVAGELTVIVGGESTVLTAYDSCTIPAEEVRELRNNSNHVCTMLAILPYPPAPAA